MLAKKKRLSRAVFSEVSSGKAVHFPLFTIRVSPALLGKERFSVVISKKVASKASDRNALRRRIYETVRSVDPKKYSAVIFLKKGVREEARHVLREALGVALRNIRVH